MSATAQAKGFTLVRTLSGLPLVQDRRVSREFITKLCWKMSRLKARDTREYTDARFESRYRCLRSRMHIRRTDITVQSAQQNGNFHPFPCGPGFIQLSSHDPASARHLGSDCLLGDQCVR